MKFTTSREVCFHGKWGNIKLHQRSLSLVLQWDMWFANCSACLYIFGKKPTKSLHHDMTIQLALYLLPYYRHHECPLCCYEKAMAKTYYHGCRETRWLSWIHTFWRYQSIQNPSSSLSEQHWKILDAFAKNN